jgi:hypothetical protein
MACSLKVCPMKLRYAYCVYFICIQPFTATKLYELFSGWWPCQLFKNLRHFRDTLRLHPQGNDVSGTHCVSIPRETTFQRHTPSPSSGKQRFRDTLRLHPKGNDVSETLHLHPQGNDVSETHSVSILRETTFQRHSISVLRETTFQRHIPPSSSGKQRFRDTLRLHPKGNDVSETLYLRPQGNDVSETHWVSILR